jgi:small redox-active disulfide protein 2
MEIRVKVLGTGCIQCNSLFHNTLEAMKNLEIDEEVEMITNSNDIIAYGVAETPALVIDEMVCISGKVPEVVELEEIFRKHRSIFTDAG